MQKEFEYCGVRIMIFVRGVPKVGYEGLSTADIWYCLPVAGRSPVAATGEWTLLTQRKMIVSASADEVIVGAASLVRQFIDGMLADRINPASEMGQG